MLSTLNKIYDTFIKVNPTDFNPEDSIKVSIEDVTIGMFITGIQKSGRVNLKKAGRILSSDKLKSLKDGGIQFVWVDPKLSDTNCIFVDSGGENTSSKEKGNVSGKIKETDFKRDHHSQAKKVVSEAKELVQKLLKDTFDGKNIKLVDVEILADKMIESALVNTDALLYASALRDKDAYLLEHSVNVSCLLISFGKYLGLSKADLKELAIGGIIHDVGKIRIDDSILKKPAKLTPEEFEHMKMHQVYAEEIILKIKGLNSISKDVCLMHHEKLDGNGYPHGLAGEQISLYGRMSSIVDIYDALTAERVYKKGVSPDEAFKILLSLTPFHLDADLVYKFINCIGVYPVGCIVQLNDGRVGVVLEANKKEPLNPRVKCFYSRKFKNYIDVVIVDLKKSIYKITKTISPSDLELDPKPFY